MSLHRITDRIASDLNAGKIKRKEANDQLRNWLGQHNPDFNLAMDLLASKQR